MHTGSLVRVRVRVSGGGGGGGGRQMIVWTPSQIVGKKVRVVYAG